MMWSSEQGCFPVESFQTEGLCPGTQTSSLPLPLQHFSCFSAPVINVQKEIKGTHPEIGRLCDGDVFARSVLFRIKLTK